MKLTEEQKAEIRDYIVIVPKYKETYDELYDHILNSLTDSENEFSLNEVSKIVEADFGGFSEIVHQEKIYHEELGRKYHKNFRLQFINTLKWPGVLVFALCVMVYNSDRATLFNTRPILLGVAICFLAIAVFIYTMIIANRIKYSKYSILDSHLGIECSFGFGLTNIVFYGFGNENFFGLGEQGKLIVMLFLVFFCSIYVRTFIKFYNKKFKVLTAG